MAVLKYKDPKTGEIKKVGALSLTSEDIGAVPISRTVNGKELKENISLTPADIGAATQTEVNQLKTSVSEGKSSNCSSGH